FQDSKIYKIIAAVGLTRGFCVLMETNLSESRIFTDDTDFTDFKSFLILRVFSPVGTICL
ncbi:MAG: hypothetical protein OXM61_09260, partial [Candidatus Poribacteria bacterium]|nr:hypothetical protein [Candidatus Poribacteria bacterium]